MKRRLLPLLLAALLLLAIPAPTAGASYNGGVAAETAIEAQFDGAAPFSGGLAAVKRGGKWGYIDERGGTVVPFEYDYAGPFSDGCALAGKIERFPDPYAAPGAAAEDMLVFYLLRDTGAAARLTYRDAAGHVYPVFERAAGFVPGDYAACRFNDGAIVVRGRVFSAQGVEIRPRADTLRALADTASGLNFWWLTSSVQWISLSPLCVDGQVMMELYGDIPGTPGLYFQMDLEGALTRDYAALSSDNALFGSDAARVNVLYPPVDGLLCAGRPDTAPDGSVRELYGMLDTAGRWVIEPRYTDFRCLSRGVFFSNDLWVVRNAQGRFGAVNRAGSTVIPFDYDALTVFADGFAGAEKDGAFFYLGVNNVRYDVSLPGGAVGKVTGGHMTGGVALAADSAGNVWFVQAVPTGGVLPAVSGRGLAAPEVYFSGGAVSGVSPLMAVKNGDGKYGYVRLTFDLPTPPPFHDIKAGEFYYDAVLWALEQGLVETGSGFFAPSVPSTRAQVVEYLWKAAGSPAPSAGVIPFTDVPAGVPYREAVIWAYEKGITRGNGSADLFSPEEPVTRGQLVTFLHRVSGLPAAGTLNPFLDVPAGQFYTDAILWASEKGITRGTTPTTFSPYSNVTNGELVTFLHRWAGTNTPPSND